MSEFDRKSDWIDWLTGIAGALGMNKVRVRWKLMYWRDSWARSRQQASNTVEEVGYRHKVCPHCGTLQDEFHKTCANCGKLLLPHWLEVLKRAGIGLPEVQSVSSLLTLVMIAIYVRMILFQGPSGVLSFDMETLIRFGAHWREATEAGQFWRISTAMFLHAGLLHIFFNLFALMQVGPIIEQIFGRGRMLFLYMVTGLIGNIASELWISHGLAIGASGAIMGLIGVAAGWGQRDGTRMGQSIRDQMVKWLIYTVVFGLMIGADNAAHIGGFVSGALFGYFYKPHWGGMDRHTFLYNLETGVGILLAGATVFLVFFPPG
jgi:rhomboid protease GluP